MEKKLAAIQPAMSPAPKVLISCRGADGKDNALAVAYCSNCSYDPPMVMVGIVPSRHSYQMVKDTGCFVVNLVEDSYADIFNYLGSASGRDEDKLATKNVALAKAEIVNAPLLADCPVNIECTVVDSIRTGSHEMFVGRIERVHARADLVKEDGKIDFSGVTLL